MQAIRIEKNLRIETGDRLACEAPLQISVNGMPFSVTMRTPGDDAALAVGLLFTEGVIAAATDVLRLKQRDHWIDIEVPEARKIKQRRLISAASCGVCGKTELCDLHMPERALTTELRLNPGLIPHMHSQMHAAQKLFSETGGVHAAAAFNIQGQMLVLHEDIGRHNAVDKTIGFLLRQGQLCDAAVLFVSGRVSYEIVAKTHRAQIPFLAAVSAVSDMAAEICQAQGITLLGFCREERATVYSHAERILPDYNHARTA